MSAKNAITLADLNDAIRPLIEALNKINLQQSEMYQMITNISVKLDAVEQKAEQASESNRSAPKKLVGRGKTSSTKKATTKKATTKKSKKTEESEDEVEEEEVVEVVEEDDEEEEEKKAPVKKAPVKKAPVKKASTKKTTTKKAETKKAPAKANIMTVFKLKFKENEKQFVKWLTPEIKKEIETENKDVWEELEGDELMTKRANVYYSYMKEHHEDVLKEFRDKYAKETSEEPEEGAEEDE
jgi:hypothetical protein